MSAEAPCNFYVHIGANKGSAPMQGITSKILENHILFWLYALAACGKENAEGC